MKKMTKLSLLGITIGLMIQFFSSFAYADLAVPPKCRPGQDPSQDTCIPANSNIYTNGRNISPSVEGSIGVYILVGVTLVGVTAISAVILLTIRRRNGQ